MKPHPPGTTILAARQARWRRQRFRTMAVIVMVAAVVAVLVAIRTDPSTTFAAVDPENLPVAPPVPELAATGWINSAPLTSDVLVGKVVLYDFWTYSCVNCVRTIPHLRSWHERYRDDGLVVVGVHTPEFAFEKDRGNVEGAMARLGVTWPVALDEERNIWNAFRNQGWPSKYVTDRTGALRYLHFGEGRYTETEDVLRHLLDVPDDAPRAERPSRGGGDEPDYGDVTAETHLGTLRGTVALDGSHDYDDAAGPPDLGDVRFAGVWEGDRERVQAGEAGATMSLAYRAREVNVVMAARDGRVDVVVELDGYPVPKALRTSQTQVDGQGRTFVRVVEDDLYRLVAGESVGRHVIRLTPQAAGLAAYAFTFG